MEKSGTVQKVVGGLQATTSLGENGLDVLALLGSDWRLERAACLEDLRSVLDAMGIHSGHTAVQAHQYTEHRVLSEAPTSGPKVSLPADESCAEVGDAIEIELSEQDPPQRVTYLLSLVSHNPNNGVVRVDSPIGQLLLGAAVGDDLQLPDSGEPAIVLGIFKGRGEPQPPPASGYSGSSHSVSLH
jgi:transcription elongation GreA/GreB family factor